MHLLHGQVSITRPETGLELIMGEGTDFPITSFNPWVRTVRAPSQTPRAWANGDWSGAEWGEARFIPINIAIDARDIDTDCPPDGDFDVWIDRQFEVAAAFAPVEDSEDQIELRWRYGTREYLVFGRPRMVDPLMEWITWVPPGAVPTQLMFVALGSLIFDSDLTVLGPITLPTFSGGLTVDSASPASPASASSGLIVPFTIDSGSQGGELELINEGTADVGLILTIRGPIDTPRVTLIRPDGIIQTISLDLFIPQGDFVIIDTEEETAFLNGTSSVRGFITGDFPILPPGTSVLRFRAASEPHPDATLEVQFRSAFK